MVYVPFAVGLKVKIEVAVEALVNVTVVGLSENTSPEGEEVPERLTVPLKPYRLETVSVEAALEPAWTVSVPGLVVTPKLGGFTLTNLIMVGVVVPSTYNRSSEVLGPVVLRLVTSLSVAVFSQMMVAFQDPPAGILMKPSGPGPPSELTLMRKR